MRPFQIILFGVFAALAVGGMLMFATFRGFGTETTNLSAGVEIWGTLDQSVFANLLEEIKKNDDNWSKVKYVQMDSKDFTQNFINSLAEGKSPDLVVIQSDLLAQLYTKLQPIPYDTYSERDYKDAFVDGADIFLFPNGIYALPFAVDPLVMYWNKNMIASAGLSTPPRTWEELTEKTLPRVTMYNDEGDILQSTVAFGEFQNVRHAKETLLMLMLQAGSHVSYITSRGINIDLNANDSNTPMPPGDAATGFFANFSSRSSAWYTWNRALPNDKDAFLAESLALYFGPGSEYKDIEDGNPNLSFDVAQVPQSGASTVKHGYGLFYGFAIPRSARNTLGAYEVAATLSTDALSLQLVKRFRFAPVHRSLIESAGGDAVATVLFRSALVARGWLDPNPEASNTIFSTMIDSISSGRGKVSEAISDATTKLQNAF